MKKYRMSALVCAALLASLATSLVACGSSPEVGPSNKTAAEIQALPTTLEVNGKSRSLSGGAFVNMAPGQNDPNMRHLKASVRPESSVTAPLPADLSLNRLFVVRGDKVWESSASTLKADWSAQFDHSALGIVPGQPANVVLAGEFSTSKGLQLVRVPGNVEVEFPQ